MPPALRTLLPASAAILLAGCAALFPAQEEVHREIEQAAHTVSELARTAERATGSPCVGAFCYRDAPYVGSTVRDVRHHRGLPRALLEQDEPFHLEILDERRVPRRPARPRAQPPADDRPHDPRRSAHPGPPQAPRPRGSALHPPGRLRRHRRPHRGDRRCRRLRRPPFPRGSHRSAPPPSGCPSTACHPTAPPPVVPPGEVEPPEDGLPPADALAARLAAGEGVGRFISGGYLEGGLPDGFTYSGDVVGLLDAAMRALGFAYWRASGSELLLGFHEQREYALALTHTSADPHAAKLRDEVLSVVRGRCGGCIVEHNPILGILVVTGFPTTLARLDAYMPGLQARLARSYLVDVSVYRVRVSHRDSFSLDLKTTFSKFLEGVTDGLDLNVSTSGNIVVSSGDLDLTDGDVKGDQGLVVQALSSAGDTSVQRRVVVPLLEGRTHAVDVSSSETFVQQVKISRSSGDADTVADPGSGSSPDSQKDVSREIVFADANSTFKVDLTVHSHGLDRVLVSSRITYTSSEPSRDLAASPPPGTTSLTTENRSFQTEQIIPLDAHWLFTAFQREDLTSDRAGLGNPDFLLLGGQRRASRTTDHYVMGFHVRRTVLPRGSG